MEIIDTESDSTAVNINWVDMEKCLYTEDANSKQNHLQTIRPWNKICPQTFVSRSNNSFQNKKKLPTN